MLAVDEKGKDFIDLLGGISRMIANSGHSSFPAARAIHWGRAHTQIRNRCRGPELAAVILVLSHAAAATTHLLTLDWGRSGSALILLRCGLAVHLLLLVHLMLVWILLHHDRLLLVVHAVRLLLVHHRLLLSLVG